MLRVKCLDGVSMRALADALDLAPSPERLDWATPSLSTRDWTEVGTSLKAFVGRGGLLRIVVRHDPQQTRPEVVQELCSLPNSEIAFGLADASDQRPECLLFFRSPVPGQVSPRKTIESWNRDGGEDEAEDPEHTPNREAIRRFEQEWERASLVDGHALEAYKLEGAPWAFREGDLVRSKIDLYRPYGIGRVQKVRGAHAKVEFNPSVFMEPPYRSENKILQLAEMERVDTPLDRAERGEWEEPWRFELSMMAARFLTGNKGGQLSNARTEILPHQIFAAHRVVSSPRRRFLLADEVGLGKTIEAGMIWQALAQRGQAKRTLIITPAGLTTQWQEEFQDKFRETFEIFGRDFWAVNPRVWDLKAKAIASLDTLKRAEHKRVLLENRKWDLIIFDEAHRLSAVDYGSGEVKRTQNYRLAEEIRDKHYCEALLLLTATPHQGEENHSRFKNLVSLLEDGVDFSSLEEPGLFTGMGNGRKFTELVIRTPKKEVTDAHGRRVFKGRQTHRLPFTMCPDEAKFYKAVAEYIRDGYQMLERVRDPKRRQAAGFLLTTFQKLNASSTVAIKSALSTRLGRLRGELAGLSEDAKEEEENGLYDGRFQGEREEQSVVEDDQEILRGEIANLESLLAMKVRRDKKLDELLGLVDHIGHESPRGEEEKVLIFTEYRKTQQHLVQELEAKYGTGSVVVIHGGMRLERREEADEDLQRVWEPFARDGAVVAPTTKRTSQRLFRDHARVRFLVSTEAGGEGINLQFCHIVVDYDLPWNPMRVEQRIGRVYRFGQDKVVQVYNFFNKGTIEVLVQSYFEDRLERAAKALAKVTGENWEDIKGTLNGQLESEIDPEKIYKRALVDGDLNKQTQKEIAEAVERAKRAYEIATQSLFRDVSSYSFASYQRELATDLTLGDLQRFTERFLSMNRRQVQRKTPFLEFLVPDVLKTVELPERYRTATFDRELAIRRNDAEFLALGHPFIDAMLGYVGSYDFGGLTAARTIPGTNLRGKSGFLFVFVVRRRITREDTDECLFRFEPVFVSSDRRIDEEAARVAVSKEATNVSPGKGMADPRAAFEMAKRHLEEKTELWDWDDDVEFVGMSWVEFA
jgi:ERCC4-related helicase